MRFSSPKIGLGLLSVVLAYAVVSYGAVSPAVVSVSLFALALIGSLHALSIPKKDWAPSMSTAMALLTIAAPAYTLFQLVPLPLSWMAALSPARSGLTATLAFIGSPASVVPIAINPSATLSSFCKVMAYLLIFLLVRQFVWRSAKRPWDAVLPLIVIGIAEAFAGLLQCQCAGRTCQFVSGTYINRNHFAGLLEMCFPFALLYPLFLLGKADKTRQSQGLLFLQVGLLLLGTGLIIVAVLASMSRTGSAIVLLALICVLGGYFSRTLPSRWKIASILGLIVLLLSVFSVAVPATFLARFKELSTPQTAAMDRRIIWEQTLSVIRDYPVFGCGLGGYASVYLKYKAGMPLWGTSFVHNDYLQGLAEVGMVGMSILVDLVTLILVPLFRLCRGCVDWETRTLAHACTVALVSLLIHGIVDFNFYIPANVMTFTWICGVAVMLPSLHKRAIAPLPSDERKVA